MRTESLMNIYLVVERDNSIPSSRRLQGAGRSHADVLDGSGSPSKDG